ncbi:MAG TPA: hypothetical protein VFT55_04550 [Planctomycetota bacterium]|nr:hypothetical protein [Planctomycetota bacterium]
MTRTTVVLSCLFVSAAGACQLGGKVEPTPLKGPPPQGIVVWPVLPEANVARDVFAGLDLAVRGRGYEVHSLAVGQQLLTEAGLLEGVEPDAARIGPALGVDAVMHLQVGAFTMEGERSLRSAHWRLHWQLVSTRGAGVLWSWEHQGSWHRSETDTSDPLRRHDADPEIVPIGGSSVPNFRDAIDVAAWLHRKAMEHLPRCRP